ncbi:MAG: DNA repair protein [Clostridia bacterium]|nr:DNA repair protein [Clostridia bacterium]
MLEDRVYFVIDMKSFFASVECAERGLDPMTTNLVVADEERSKGTICLAVTPAMKKFGVKNRCRLFEIPKGIDYIIAKPRMKKYIDYSANIYAIYLKYIDKNDIHTYSIDECIIDATDYLKLYNLKTKEFVQKLMGEILETLHIPSSAGIGTNMYLAKIALDITGKKTPDRIGWLNEEKYRQTLWKHTPLRDFWQISYGTEERLAKYGIYDMERLAHFDENILYKEFGVNAELLIDHAWGRETCLMSDIKSYKSKSKSISSSQILPKNYTFNEAKIVLKEMIQNGCYDLTNQNYATSFIEVFVAYGDKRGDISKGIEHLNANTNLYSIIVKSAEKIYNEVVKASRLVRKVGYVFMDITSSECEQYDFFTDLNKVKKEKNMVKTVLDVKDKYGKNSLIKGLDLDEKATQRERNTSIGGHKSGED